MIQVQNVDKILSKKQVLSGINFEVREGECLLLRGHNGCGKTMLLRLLCGLIEPTSGAVIYEKPYRFGVVIETPSFFLHETALYNLKYLASINKRIQEDTIVAYLKRLNLYDVKDKKVGKFSLGMKQRLALCQAFMEDPEVLLLDEPFNAIDDENLNIVYEMIRESKEKGKMVVIAAHGETGMDGLFDKKIKMSDGKIVEGA